MKLILPFLSLLFCLQASAQNQVFPPEVAPEEDVESQVLSEPVADPAPDPTRGSPSVIIGNALVRPIAVEKLIRGTLASALNANINSNQLSFRGTTEMSETIVIPQPKGVLKSIFDQLGLKNSLSLVIAPIETNFTLPASALKMNIQKQGDNSFLINASWSLTQLTAKTKSLAFKVPAGLFDKAFSIKSSPVIASLSPKSRPVEVQLNFIADLTPAGTKIRALHFKTNLNDDAHPDFQITLGQLTVDGQPLSLDIQSNGRSLNTDEPHIRAALQDLESSFGGKIRQKLGEVIQDQTEAQARAIDSRPPLSFAIHTDSFLDSSSLSPETKALLGGIDLSFLVSYLQSIPKANLFSAQVAAHICFDNQCLSDLGDPSPIGTDDIKLMSPTEDTGVVLYESMLQSIVHSDVFQRRVKKYYDTSMASPGVNLSPAGVKIFLNPDNKSVMAVLNLEIDIKETIKKGTPFGEAIKTGFGDFWESLFGSGKFVKIPIEINFSIDGFTKDKKGQRNLLIHSSLPFTADGNLNVSGRCPETECPNNVPKMTKLVRKGFLESVKKQISASVPDKILIPVADSFDVSRFSFALKQVSVTPNHGLLGTAQLKNFMGKIK